MSRMLTPAGAAEYLGMTPEELAEANANPWGPRFRGDGRDRRYDADHLDTWMAERERKRSALLAKPVLTTGEAAAYCRVPVTTLETLRSRREGPDWSRADKIIVYRRQDLDAWARSRGAK